MINFLSIDVEDYFQVSAFETVSPPSTWAARELRVVTNTDRILAILDEADAKGTFFVLGWVAERCSGLVRRIADEGHEVASHGFGHQRVYHLSRDQFREDIRRSKEILEELSGKPVLGYRAPSYSISAQTWWAFEELLAAGYCYDSSIFPIRHDLYGMADWPRFSGWAVQDAQRNWQPSDLKSPDSASLFEIPVTTLQLGGRNLPIAGGGYFRLFPYALTRWGLRRINHLDRQPFVFYLHPWEFDPEQPKMHGASAKSRFRHYLNLSRTEKRFRRLLKDFSFQPLAATLPAELLSSVESPNEKGISQPQPGSRPAI